MRKGLKITLMTVAIALVSVQAMAYAPVISDLPSPIVGSNVGVTGANAVWTKFVYPDAMDLSTLATDELTSAPGLMWTYAGSSLSYLINGVNPITLGTTDPTSPTTASIINRTVSGGEQNLDGLANTITIRNKALAPLGGSVATSVPPGLQTAQLVTFFCSDGNLYSSKTVFFYTDNGGMNRLSGGGAWQKAPIKVGSGTDLTGVNKFTSWFWAKDQAQWSVGSGGSVTTHTYNASGGMCLDIAGAQTAQNTVDLLSPYQYFTLAKNKLYRLTLKMNGSQLSPGATPLWDFIIQNAKPGDNTVGWNLYAQDTMLYDNTGFGGQNTVLNTTNGTDYIIYFAPAAVQADQWNDATTGAFAPANTAQIQPLCEFRLLDYPSDAQGAGQTKSGAVCIQQLTVEQADITRVVKQSSLVNITSFAQATSSGGGNAEAYSLFNAALSTISFSGGAITVTPGTTAVTVTGYGSVTGQDLEGTEIRPASDLTFGDPLSAPTSYLDNWPIKWNSGEVLRYQVDVIAPDASLVSAPWDAIMLNMQGLDSELLFESYMSSSQNLASPKATASTTYQVFLQTLKAPSNSGDATIAAKYAQLRWVLRFFNTPTAQFPSWTSASAKNKSPIKVTGLRVDKVIVQ